MEITAETADLTKGEPETARRVSYWRCSAGEWSETEGWVPKEFPMTIFVNGQEWVATLCTPHKLTCLVVGFLCSEGVISHPGEIAYLRVCPEEAVAEVKLSASVSLPTRRVLTSGCGGGSGFRPREKGCHWWTET